MKLKVRSNVDVLRILGHRIRIESDGVKGYGRVLEQICDGEDTWALVEVEEIDEDNRLDG
jgi:hypothetical protein